MYSAKIRHLSAPFPADKYIYCTYCTLKEHNYHTLQQTTFGENLKIFGKIMQKNANKKINNTKKTQCSRSRYIKLRNALDSSK